MLQGQIALVTGASRGIGQAIALALGRAGATVVGTATSDKGAQAIGAYLAAAGVKGAGMKLDVCNAAEVDAVIAAIEKDFGAIGVLVNNAGITRDNLLMRMKDEEWDEIMATNLTSVFRLSRAVLRAMMKARSGRIISIASVVGAMGNAGQTNYSAAKAGIMGFTKSLAREVGSRNITVNCVAPGFIDTDMTRALPEAQRAALLGHIPLGRLGAAEDIAAAVAFLASPAAGYISGTTLHVNGGMYMA
ncbi:3-oxoacyl-ACP reductase FabG [Thiobacillus sedimenti]|uniref:3-oxoacyl-[acyl-carrier-protein] reductase n=1 Tax=Thiobacillus sedimenti TaxID=3110231 RepID=A0ABZ1CM31_9PROT|nr:3-oxoacyl-ACP reductase FabG [Thiobacillus sp. SCUT-2]WRS40326.1 3-oxoacyl-ACP reductase FabG [Thiobacillus sp. SCUT-2]